MGRADQVPMSQREIPMFTAEHFQTKVAESVESLKNTDAPSEIRKFERSRSVQCDAAAAEAM
jgi:hypothetical protein